MGVHVVQRELEVWEFLFLIFTIGFPIGSPTEKCFRLFCENLTILPFSKYIIGKLYSLAFWGYNQLKMEVVVYEKIAQM